MPRKSSPLDAVFETTLASTFRPNVGGFVAPGSCGGDLCVRRLFHFWMEGRIGVGLFTRDALMRLCVCVWELENQIVGCVG